MPCSTICVISASSWSFTTGSSCLGFPVLICRGALSSRWRAFFNFSLRLRQPALEVLEPGIEFLPEIGRHDRGHEARFVDHRGRQPGVLYCFYLDGEGE